MTADNASSVRLASHLPAAVGMEPPDGILPSTKPHHPRWTGLAYERSIRNFWSHVVPAESGCWEWTASVNEGGYGITRSPYWWERYAHRLAWEMLRGRAPGKGSGYELDHQCRNRRCVNPEHLQILTVAENRAKRVYVIKSHCAKGHPKSGDNLYIDPKGRRTCRECVREANRQARRLAA